MLGVTLRGENMKDVIVFNGAHSLDFQDIRTHVIRIPEVSRRLREAQRIWDCATPEVFDFLNFLTSDDSVFMGNIRLKTLVASVVQIGLLDRYLKLNPMPEFFVGTASGDSALRYANGELSFEDLIEKSEAIHGKKAQTLSILGDGIPILAGMSLTEYSAFKKEADSYVSAMACEMDFMKLAKDLVEDLGVERFINIGPGNVLINRKNMDPVLEEAQVLESIDLDPMLSWFWSSLSELKATAS